MPARYCLYGFPVTARSPLASDVRFHSPRFDMVVTAVAAFTAWVRSQTLY
jgi:hypothetical protein